MCSFINKYSVCRQLIKWCGCPWAEAHVHQQKREMLWKTAALLKSLQIYFAEFLITNTKNDATLILKFAIEIIMPKYEHRQFCLPCSSGDGDIIRVRHARANRSFTLSLVFKYHHFLILNLHHGHIKLFFFINNEHWTMYKNKLNTTCAQRDLGHRYGTGSIHQSHMLFVASHIY